MPFTVNWAPFCKSTGEDIPIISLNLGMGVNTIDPNNWSNSGDNFIT